MSSTSAPSVLCGKPTADQMNRLIEHLFDPDLLINTTDEIEIMYRILKKHSDVEAVPIWNCRDDLADWSKIQVDNLWEPAWTNLEYLPLYETDPPVVIHSDSELEETLRAERKVRDGKARDTALLFTVNKVEDVRKDLFEMMYILIHNEPFVLSAKECNELNDVSKQVKNQVLTLEHSVGRIVEALKAKLKL